MGIIKVKKNLRNDDKEALPAQNKKSSFFSSVAFFLKEKGPRVLRASKKKNLRFILGGVLLLLLLLSFVQRILNWIELQSALHESQLIYVHVVQPEKTNPFISLTLPGTTQGFYETPIWARVNGYIKKWYVDIGDRVKTGQLLCEIDAPEVDKEVEHARAKAEIARISYERWKNLVKSRAVSAQEYDVQRTGYEAALAELDKLLQWQSFEKVTAPFDGVITARNIDIGTLVAGQNEAVQGAHKQLYRIAQIDVLRIYIAVPQTYSFSIKEGMTAEVIVPEQAGTIYPGKVVRTSFGLETASRTLLTEVDVENPEMKLLPGLYVIVSIKVPSVAPWTIPVNTLFIKEGQHYVTVIDKNNICHLKKVEVGNNDGYKAEILKGIDPEDRIVLNPPDEAKIEGTKVVVVHSK
ncbi:efflux RND transporter periplasmic adaptor subunit [Candidatus Methylacidiphilum fumarolicum]|uniref:Membrane-fusion protein n=2 Tax=Candidatus Methylacidiphilum fumarolicum TaxID=591154 RepID=I0K044_METFB|nr:efflux RND transporter periplasmic adaptor subunit [Candidatus Methylacidiphilum fumarolicum]MBW6415113.1 efflux RND transporter periplasmic adaptor subunit [Candidatus Methylacidiphilum fumarolicum]TFE66006.1 efflux transporter periplasmic adaptor subunit [Candidatus Methylacidiphilum fumarolicum]TFE72734.1 efflux RND transporter periplasmic adaptor subunit [Candidatus Methylacidiphilum fumarolicum]TFE73199.1 efflux RND transporter periplasmic adaptor subunit [Candidatus Methylacidiphilum f